MERTPFSGGSDHPGSGQRTLERLASVDFANEISAFVHQLLIPDFGTEIGAAIPVLYGGSVNAENAVAYPGQNDIDGLFIGRAAWKVEGLIEILKLSRAVLTDRQNVV